MEIINNSFPIFEDFLKIFKILEVSLFGLIEIDLSIVPLIGNAKGSFNYFDCNYSFGGFDFFI